MKGKELVEQWWINLYDSIEPAKEKVDYAKEYQREYRKSPKYKEYKRERQKSPKYKEYKREYYIKNRERILNRIKQK